jgi:hypothetical protein
MRPLVEPELKRKFFIYTKTSRTPSPAAERFISVLGEYSL